MDEACRLCVIGVGNPSRGDDAAGILVARQLRAALPPRVPIVECGGDAAELVDALGRAQAAIVVDAGRFGAPPGTIRRFDVGQQGVPVRSSPSSHGLGLAHAIELARVLGQLPEICIVYLIEGICFDVGAPPSSAVSTAIPEAAARLRREVAALVRRVTPRAGPGCSAPRGGTGGTPARH